MAPQIRQVAPKALKKYLERSLSCGLGTDQRPRGVPNATRRHFEWTDGQRTDDDDSDGTDDGTDGRTEDDDEDDDDDDDDDNDDDDDGKMTQIHLNYVPIYRKIHRIRISYSN